MKITKVVLPLAALAVLAALLLVACGGGDGLSGAEVEEIIRAELADAPAPEPGLTAAEAERIARGVVASIPPRSAPAAYTKFFVEKAISRYETQGLDATLAYYNRPESTDGQWYVFIADENKTIVAHAAAPDLVGKHASQALGPNSYPAGSAVAASATESGAWSHYTYTNPASAAVETKHSWVIIHDGLIFGSGWYEPGPSKSDAPSYTKAFVEQATNLYNAMGLEETLAYYNRPESIDGQWYVFVIDENDLVIGHPDANRLGLDLKGWVGTDANGYNFGPGMLSATEDGKWVSYVYRNPESGGLGIDFDHLITWSSRTSGSCATTACCSPPAGTSTPMSSPRPWWPQPPACSVKGGWRGPSPTSPVPILLLRDWLRSSPTTTAPTTLKGTGSRS